MKENDKEKTNNRHVEQVSMQGLIDRDKYQGQHAFFNDRIGIMLDLGVVPENEWMQPGRPYRSKDWRIVRTTGGEARYVLNLKEYTFHRNTVQIQPPGTLVMKLSQSEDNSAEFISLDALSELKARIPVGHIVYYDCDEQAGQLFDEYFKLILHMAQNPDTPFTSIHLAAMALAEDIMARQKSDVMEDDDKAKRSTKQQLYDRFIEALNKYGRVKHDINFYADCLFVSPNYLSKVVKAVSGQTVVWWINYTIILEAKMLLLHSNLQVGEIAERLGFSNFPLFSRFFKRETGQTALDFERQ